MISRRPTNSMIGVTHSDTEAWIAADRDVLNVWPDATGYTYITAFEGWPNWSGPNVALLWEVFGPDCPGPDKSQEIQQWARQHGAVKRAQHVFLLPDVLDVQPLLIYRALTAPAQDLVETVVERAKRIREQEAERQRLKDELGLGNERLGNNAELDGYDKPFDQEAS